MKRLGIAVGALVGVFALMQLRRPDQSNPPVTGALHAPADVQAVLSRACFDCHSNETVWPWYAQVAPVSWLVAHHVEEGRAELNFSTWAAYPLKKQAHKLEEVEEQVREGEMPMAGYVAMHATAKLSDADRQLLMTWAKETKAALEAPVEVAPVPTPAPDAVPTDAGP